MNDKAQGAQEQESTDGQTEDNSTDLNTDVDPDVNQEETASDAESTEEQTSDEASEPDGSDEESDEEDSSEKSAPKTFTEDEMNELVKERLGRQEKKLKREFNRSAELQANSEQTNVTDDVIYDPATGQPLPADDPRYIAIKEKKELEAAVSYNESVAKNNQLAAKMLREEEKIIIDVQDGYEDQLENLRSSDPKGFTQLDAEKLLDKPVCFGLVQAVTSLKNGVSLLSSLMQDEKGKNEVIRISNLPYSLQLLQMSNLLHQKNRGAGDPIVKSNAPPPVKSLTGSVGNAIAKSDNEKSFDEAYAETRARRNI
jgi:hypothetical protein